MPRTHPTHLALSFAMLVALKCLMLIYTLLAPVRLKDKTETPRSKKRKAKSPYRTSQPTYNTMLPGPQYEPTVPHFISRQGKKHAKAHTCLPLTIMTTHQCRSQMHDSCLPPGTPPTTDTAAPPRGAQKQHAAHRKKLEEPTDLTKEGPPHWSSPFYKALAL